MTLTKNPELIKQTSVNNEWEECSNISVYRGENDSLDSELSNIIGDTGGSTRRDSSGDSASLKPQEPGVSIPRRTLRISKATGILADM